MISREEVLTKAQAPATTMLKLQELEAESDAAAAAA